METQSPNKQTWGSAAFKISRAPRDRKSKKSLRTLAPNLPALTSEDEEDVAVETPDSFNGPKVNLEKYVAAFRKIKKDKHGKVQTDEPKKEIQERVWFPGLLSMITFCYLLIGGTLFLIFEKQEDQNVQEDVLGFRNTVLIDFKKISRNFTERMKNKNDHDISLLNDEFQKEVNHLIDVFFFNISNAVITHGWNGFVHVNNWNFIRSMRYCFSVITTVGYGDIFPRTLCGQVFTVVYASFGIPQIMLFCDITGKSVKTLLDKTYSRFKKMNNNVQEQIRYCLLNLKGVKEYDIGSINNQNNNITFNIEKDGTKNKTDEGLSLKKSNKENYEENCREHVFAYGNTNTNSDVDPEGTDPQGLMPVISAESLLRLTSSIQLDGQEPKASIRSLLLSQEEAIPPEKTNKKVRKKTSKKDNVEEIRLVMEDNSLITPSWWYLTAIFLYLCLGAQFMHLWEKIEFARSLYGSFIILSTIGFGDIVMGNGPCSVQLYESLNYDSDHNLREVKLIPESTGSQAIIFVNMVYIYIGMPFIPIIIQRIAKFLETHLSNTETELYIQFQKKYSTGNQDSSAGTSVSSFMYSE